MRFIATVRLDVEGQSRESVDYLLGMVVSRLDRAPAGVTLPDVGAATVRSAKLSRVRKGAGRKR